MDNEVSKTKLLHIPSTAGNLPLNWRWSRLDNICDGVFDCPHSTPEIATDGPLMARSQDIRSGVFRVEEAAHVSEETYKERIKRAEPIYGDLLYSREGTYFGIAAEVPPDVRVCLGQRMVLIRPSMNQLHFRFLRFWLNSQILTSHVNGMRDGTVAERLNLPTIRGLPIPIPPLPEQTAIAHILGTLDDKIELNRRMNETLEAMARALFKSWFVDFDPVRAKAEKRQPAGMDAETAALFPSSFGESPLGPIPKHWKLGKFADLATLSRAAINPNQHPDEVFDHFSIPAYDEGMMPKQEAGGQIMSNKFLVVSNCVLLSKLNPRFPRVWLPDLSAASHRAVCSTEFLVLLSKAQATREWVYALVSSGSFLEILSSLVTGTSSSHQRVKPEHLFNVKTVIPPEAIIHSFTKMVGPNFAMITQNLQQSRTLAALRDALLPKLLSGEIRVREAESEVEQVA